MPSKLIPLVTPSSRKDGQIYSFSSTNQWDVDTNSWLFSDCQQRCQVHHGHPPMESKQIPLTASPASCPALRHPRWPGGWGGESLVKGPALHIDVLPVLLLESWLKLLYCCTLVNVFCLTLPHSSDPFLWVGFNCGPQNWAEDVAFASDLCLLLLIPFWIHHFLSGIFLTLHYCLV